MILPTGNKRGFTLVEVMVAVSVLALAVVMLHESYFISLDAYAYYARYLNTAYWMDEKLWEVKDEIRRLGEAAQLSGSGVFSREGRDFNWELSLIPRDSVSGLYQINLQLLWEEGKRKPRISRNAYALYEK